MIIIISASSSSRFYFGYITLFMCVNFLFNVCCCQTSIKTCDAVGLFIMWPSVTGLTFVFNRIQRLCWWRPLFSLTSFLLGFSFCALNRPVSIGNQPKLPQRRINPDSSTSMKPRFYCITQKPCLTTARQTFTNNLSINTYSSTRNLETKQKIRKLQNTIFYLLESLSFNLNFSVLRAELHVGFLNSLSVTLSR